MEKQPKDINEYLRLYAGEMADRIAQHFPPLYRAGDPVPAEIERLRRKPYPAQTVAICGVARRWDEGRAAAVVVTFSKSWPKRPYFGLSGPGHFMVYNHSTTAAEPSAFTRTGRIHFAA
jgi:hypothetical protein